MKTGAFFRPVILRDRLRDLNKRMFNMRAEEIVETLSPDFFNRLLDQYVYDEGVKLKVMRSGQLGIEEKKQQSTTQFAAQDKLESVGELGGGRKSVTARSKNDKFVSVIEDKNVMKDLLERKRRSPWIVRIFILMIILFLLGMTAILIVGYAIYIRTSDEQKMAYAYAEISSRKTAELLYVKSHIRSLIFRNK